MSQSCFLTGSAYFLVLSLTWLTALLQCSNLNSRIPGVWRWVAWTPSSGMWRPMSPFVGVHIRIVFQDARCEGHSTRHMTVCNACIGTGSVTRAMLFLLNAGIGSAGWLEKAVSCQLKPPHPHPAGIVTMGGTNSSPAEKLFWRSFFFTFRR